MGVGLRNQWEEGDETISCRQWWKLPASFISPESRPPAAHRGCLSVRSAAPLKMSAIPRRAAPPAVEEAWGEDATLRYSMEELKDKQPPPPTPPQLKQGAVGRPPAGVPQRRGCNLSALRSATLGGFSPT